jgi:rhomboid protease GluP
MNKSAYKLKQVYLPFVLILFAFITLYSFLNWFVFIRTNLTFSIDEVITGGVIPFFLIIIILFFVYWKRLKLLVYSKKGGPVAFTFFSAAFIIVPNFFAQQCVNYATGKLTVLNDILQLKTVPETKFYSIRNYNIDTSDRRILNVTSINGKHNEYFNMKSFIVSPIKAPSDSSISANYVYWIGNMYEKETSNNISDLEKEDALKGFLDSVIIIYNNTDHNKFIYLERLSESFNRTKYIETITKDNAGKSSELIVFNSVNQPFEKRNNVNVQHFLIAFVVSLGVWFLIIIFMPVKATNYQKGDSNFSR